ncbi:resolvase [Halopenitus sp. H-Gu1]|uniref:resolvase n=1 Tax=Halopenitus sp. H-Gu1 TaxID=3242697 RepID=UPI00359DCC9A
MEDVDLGIHTGFSRHTRGIESDNRLDANPEVQAAIERLRDGKYDHVFAFDDTRICRDDYYFVIKDAAIKGSAEFVFADDIDSESLAFRVKRVVEMWVKLQEISKSKEARAERRENGGREGESPTGLDWDDERLGWEPDEDFEGVLRVLAMKDSGYTHREVVEAVDVVGSTGTVSNILNRRDEYEQQMIEHGYSYPGLETKPI